MCSPLVAGGAYAVTLTESNMQHGGSKAGFIYFVFAPNQEIVFTSDNVSSRK
jgi:hypothetical protein